RGTCTLNRAQAQAAWREDTLTGATCRSQSQCQAYGRWAATAQGETTARGARLMARDPRCWRWGDSRSWCSPRTDARASQPLRASSMVMPLVLMLAKGAMLAYVM